MIYLDNAATSWPKPEPVYRAVDRWQREVGVGPARGDSGRTAEVEREIGRLRRLLGTMFGADPDCVVFTCNATDALNLALKGLLAPGDHVVTTRAEHSSVVRPLLGLEPRGVATTFVAVDAEGRVRAADIAAACTSKTRLIVASHASNVTGVVQPVAEIGRIARARGIRFLVDAAQTAGRVPFTLAEIGADLIAAPGHKALLGPPGTGFLAMAAPLPVRPWREGGTGSSRALDRQPEELPTRLEAGTPNTPGLLGLLAGIEFVTARGIAALHHAELARLDELHAALAPALRAGTVRALGPGPGTRERVAVLSLRLAGLGPAEVGLALDASGIAVRTGFHCAPYLHEALGTADQGTVRLSPGVFTTSADVHTAARMLLELA